MAANFASAVNVVRAKKKISLFNKKLQQKTVDLTDSSKPKIVKRYCRTLTKSSFAGERESYSEYNIELGKLLENIHHLIDTGRGFSKEADELLDQIAHLRASKLKNENEEIYNDKLQKMKLDYRNFLRIREDSIAKVEESRGTEEPINHAALCHHDDYWGSRQQLRSGKVVADMLGGMDPVFGVLLSPTGGRVGSGDSETLHTIFYREDSPLSYHAAVHDAFGYLIKHHNKGPGYNYLNTKWTFFRRESPLACQTAGYKFWKKTLKRTPVGKMF